MGTEISILKRSMRYIPEGAISAGTPELLELLLLDGIITTGGARCITSNIGTPIGAIPINVPEGAIAMGIIGIWGSAGNGVGRKLIIMGVGCWGCCGGWKWMLKLRWISSSIVRWLWRHWRCNNVNRQLLRHWMLPRGLDTTSWTSDKFVTIKGPLPGWLNCLRLEVQGCLLSDRLIRQLSNDSSPLWGSPTWDQPFLSNVENHPAYMYLYWNCFN